MIITEEFMQRKNNIMKKNLIFFPQNWGQGQISAALVLNLKDL